MICVPVSIDYNKHRLGSTYVDIVYHHVLDGGIFKVLAKATNGNAVTTMARYIRNTDIVRAWFDGNTVISTLIRETIQFDVVCIHGIYFH